MRRIFGVIFGVILIISFSTTCFAQNQRATSLVKNSDGTIEAPKPVQTNGGFGYMGNGNPGPLYQPQYYVNRQHHNPPQNHGNYNHYRPQHHGGYRHHNPPQHHRPQHHGNPHHRPQHHR